MDKERIFEVIKETIIDIMDDALEDESAITPEESLHGLGANSIDRMDIIMDVSDKLGVKIPMTQFASIHNLKEMTELFNEYLQ